jgi:hypothetical protein
MLQTLALKIDKHTYPIAAALLNGGFLAIPEKDTYGNVVVINQIIAPQPNLITAGGRRRPHISYGPIRHLDSRSITFENSWYEEETFNAEYTVDTTSNGAPGFWVVSRKPEAEIQKFYKEKLRQEGGNACACDGQCEYCHLDTEIDD